MVTLDWAGPKSNDRWSHIEGNLDTDTKGEGYVTKRQRLGDVPTSQGSPPPPETRARAGDSCPPEGAGLANTWIPELEENKFLLSYDTHL